MKSIHKPVRSWVSVAVATCLFNQAVHAGAFSLYTEASTVAIGNFAAGVAAEGADASIGWYNPAGLVLFSEPEAVLSGVGVFPKTHLSGTSIFNTDEYDPYVQGFTNLQGAENAAVPALHYVYPLGSRAAAGLSIVSPFGLSTDWGDTSPVRYSATYSQLLTVTVSPELGGLITDDFSVGLGLDLQWARVTFNGVLGSPAALQYLQSIGGLVTPETLDSTSQNRGSSFGVGFHAGVLKFLNDDHTRIGLNYQSGVGHQFQGTSTLTGRLADPELDDPNAVFVSNVLNSNTVQLPDMITLSVYQDVTDRFALLGSVVYSLWNPFETIALNHVAAYSPDTGEQELTNMVVQENYRNAWRFAIGANYDMTERWRVRFGGGFDQTPTVNAERDVRLPDVDRWALSIGSHYQLKQNLGLDVGYTYLFGNGQSPIQKTTVLGESSSNTITALAKNNAQLLGLQVVWDMDKA